MKNEKEQYLAILIVTLLPANYSGITDKITYCREQLYPAHIPIFYKGDALQQMHDEIKEAEAAYYWTAHFVWSPPSRKHI